MSGCGRAWVKWPVEGLLRPWPPRLPPALVVDLVAHLGEFVEIVPLAGADRVPDVAGHTAEEESPHDVVHGVRAQGVHLVPKDRRSLAAEGGEIDQFVDALL